MTIISARDSAHDFIVKFSPSMCVAVVASLTGEMNAQSFAYDTHMEQQTVTWFACHNKSAMLIAQAHPPPNWWSDG